MSIEAPSIKSIQEWLQGKKNHLHSLLRTANQLITYQTLIQQLLPEPLARHCYVAGYHTSVLTLIVDSSAWAHRLRFFLPELQDRLKRTADFRTLTEIRYKVDPSWLRTKQHLPKQSPLTLSTNSAQLVKATAENIADPALREALLRLSQRTKETSR